MKKPLISVVIPAYNEENYIEDCLRSVLAQDFPKKDYEVIVVDNNSTDNTASFVKNNFSEVRLVQEKRQGVVFARIKGV
ncbi:MAG: glycosyltransferase, partial [Microgenomates group bacterium]